jgi:hypothetical protein
MRIARCQTFFLLCVWLHASLAWGQVLSAPPQVTISVANGAINATPAAAATGGKIDCDFPGGNIVVDSIQGDTVLLHQDLRDTEGDWFYWYFRVRGAAGRTLHFQFDRGKDVIGLRGPAVSLDGGHSWRWLGAETARTTSFSYAIPPDAEEVRFSVTIPYLESNLHEFLDHYHGNANLKVDTLCRTRKGRPVDLLHLGKLEGQPDYGFVNMVWPLLII